MNTLAIILGVLIIILLFVLYQWYSSTAKILKAGLIDLTTTQQAITTIPSPTNTQYAYGIWLYVNNWDNAQNKVIFNHQGVLNVYLVKNKPTLCVDVNMSNSTSSNPVVISTIVTNNFPLQKWVYIIVSLDNQFLDVYLDGKLIKSARLTNAEGSTFPVIPSQTPQVFLGNANQNNVVYNGSNSGTTSNTTPFNAYVTNFNRWITPMDPGTAWRYYLKGNGQTSMFGNMNAYGVQMQVLQNNTVESTYRLF